jgi:RsiW-degrading membrane proteinase PrsW (M82 family)
VENVIVILFLCVAVPMLPVLALLPDRRSRLFLGFLLLGTAVCLFAAEFNALLLRAFGGDMLYVTTNITPVSEEILKSLPVLFFAWAVSDDRDTLVSVAFAVGLGFALLENLVILAQNLSSVSVLWAFARGLGAALMHSTCTSLVGLGAGYIRKRRKLFWCGTFSLLTSAIIYHGIFNSLVQSQYRFLAFVLPALVCVPQLAILHRKRA